MRGEEIITLRSEDGIEQVCRMLGVFELEGQEYALLLDTGGTDAGSEGAGETVLMRVVQSAGEAIFRTIEDDEEFARVTSHVRELVAEME